MYSACRKYMYMPYSVMLLCIYMYLYICVILKNFAMIYIYPLEFVER